MHMAIRLSSIMGTSRITSVKVPRRRTRLMKAPTWVRQQGVKDCWSCDGCLGQFGQSDGFGCHVSYGGKEKCVDGDDGPEVLAGLLVPHQIGDGPDANVAVSVEASPQGLHERAGGRIRCHLYDAVADEHGHHGMDDGGRHDGWYST